MSKSARPEREALWEAVLRAAGEVARRAAASEDGVARAVTEELRQLNVSGTLTLLRPDGLLETRTRTVSPALEATLRRLTGMDSVGYRFDPQRVDLYRQALAGGQAVYAERRSQVVAQIVPPMVRPLLPRIIHLLGESPIIVAPVILGAHTLGALNVAAGWLQPEDTRVVQAFADHAAIALGQVRARHETEASLARERLRNQAAAIIASSLNPAEVVQRVLLLAIEMTGAQAGGIALLDPDGETVTFQYLFGLPAELRERRPRGQGLVWKVIESRRPVLTEDYAHSPDAIAAWVRAGLHSTLGLPLVVGEEAIGALGLFILDRSRFFQAEQVETAEAFAQMAAIAIRNSRSFAEARGRAEESRALIRSAVTISSSLDLQTVLTEICEQAKGLFQADGSRIHLLDPESGRLRCVVAVQPDAEAIMRMELAPGQGLTGAVLQSGEPLIVNDVSIDQRAIHVPGTPEDDPEVLALVPLKVRQRTMGVMTVLRFDLDRPFVPRELELLNAFAAHAAVALENAHLYGQIGAQAQRLEAEVAARTRQLAMSEARYRALVETSLAGIFQADLDGRIVYANQALARMMGMTQAEMSSRLPLPGSQRVDNQPIHLDRFAARMHGDRPAKEVYDFELPTAVGGSLPTLFAVSMIEDEDGRPQGVTGLVLDISERKSLEAALQAERDRLHAILTHIGDAVVVTDTDGRIEYVNPAWERLNGFASQEAVGENVRMLNSGKQTAELYSDMWATLLSGRTWRGQLVNQRRDGSLYDAAVTIAPIEDEQHRVVNMVGVQVDISALKELDRMKSQFVSDVSHELRTPLTNIRLYLDLLGSAPDGERKARYLETLRRESERLTNLIDDLLSLSRLEAGTIAFNPRPTDLNALLTALVEDRRALAASRGLALSLEPETGLPRVMGDERLLTQVFTNLLTNAMNYTLDGGRIALRTRTRASDEAPWVTVEVEDSGLGIPFEEQTQLFRRFFRGMASRETKAPGTGLGLAICKEIVDRHAGRVTVESEGKPGLGTKFTVWLRPMAA